ncbi:hypothetical protein H0H93_008027 [Arthromyces matolae]|nr:hypothetical protein H0H93_008027 [Arthromyces matolae]
MQSIGTSVELMTLILGHVASEGLSTNIFPSITASRLVSAIAVKILWSEFPIKLSYLIDLLPLEARVLLLCSFFLPDRDLQDLDHISEDSWEVYRHHAFHVKTLRIGTADRECSPPGYHPKATLSLDITQMSTLLRGGMFSMSECFPRLAKFSFLLHRFERTNNGTVVGFDDDIPLSFFCELPFLMNLRHLSISFHQDPSDGDSLPSTIALPDSLVEMEVEGSMTELLYYIRRCSAPSDIQSLSLFQSCDDEDYIELLRAVATFCGSDIQVVCLSLVTYWQEWDGNMDDVEDWEDIFLALENFGGSLRTLVLEPPTPLSFAAIDHTLSSWGFLGIIGVNLTFLKLGRYEFYDADLQEVAVDLRFLISLAQHLPLLEHLLVPFYWDGHFLPSDVPSIQNTRLQSLGYACGEIGKAESRKVISYVHAHFPNLGAVLEGKGEWSEVVKHFH